MKRASLVALILLEACGARQAVPERASESASTRTPQSASAPGADASASPAPEAAPAPTTVASLPEPRHPSPDVYVFPSGSDPRAACDRLQRLILAEQIAASEPEPEGEGWHPPEEEPLRCEAIAPPEGQDARAAALFAVVGDVFQPLWVGLDDGASLSLVAMGTLHGDSTGSSHATLRRFVLEDRLELPGLELSIELEITGEGGEGLDEEDISASTRERASGLCTMGSTIGSTMGSAPVCRLVVFEERSIEEHRRGERVVSRRSSEGTLTVSFERDGLVRVAPAPGSRRLPPRLRGLVGEHRWPALPEVPASAVGLGWSSARAQ